MSYASDRMFSRLVFTIALVAFPIGLIIFAFSSCDVRKRSEKAACRHGEVAVCLEVGKYYEDKDDGIIGFLMSNADTAVAYYYRACALKSPVGCERMNYVFIHADQAKNLSTELTDMADALIDACAARVDGTCEQLWVFKDQEGDWVAVRSAQAFDRRCTDGEAQACYQLGRMHAQNLGGQQNVLEEVLPIYEKGCAGGIADACKGAQDYRDEQARRAAKKAGAAEVGSGSGSALP